MVVSSCESWSPDLSPDTGTLDFSAFTVTVDSRFDDVVSRADGGTDVTDYIVTLTDSHKSVVNQWLYNQMPTSVELPVGSYVLTVESPDAEAVAWDASAFKGEVMINVTDGEQTVAAPVTCTPTGATISVVYTDALKELMSDDSQATVSLADDMMLGFTKSESRVGCFNKLFDGDNSLLVKFEGTVNEQPVEVVKAINQVAKRKHYIMTFSLKSDADGSSVVIDVKGVANPDAPTITSTTLDLDNVTTLTAGNYMTIRALIDISAPKGIKQLLIKIDSDKLTANELAMVGLSDEFDLCNPGDLAGALSALGFPVGDAVIGKTGQSFDITFFLGLLINFPGKNDFIITVVDNENNTTSQTVKFYVP